MIRVRSRIGAVHLEVASFSRLLAGCAHAQGRPADFRDIPISPRARLIISSAYAALLAVAFVHDASASLVSSPAGAAAYDNHLGLNRNGELHEFPGAVTHREDNAKGNSNDIGKKSELMIALSPRDRRGDELRRLLLGGSAESGCTGEECSNDDVNEHGGITPGAGARLDFKGADKRGAAVWLRAAWAGDYHAAASGVRRQALNVKQKAWGARGKAVGAYSLHPLSILGRYIFIISITCGLGVSF